MDTDKEINIGCWEPVVAKTCPASALMELGFCWVDEVQKLSQMII